VYSGMGLSTTEEADTMTPSPTGRLPSTVAPLDTSTRLPDGKWGQVTSVQKVK
jgi:hypothetical protein